MTGVQTCALPISVINNEIYISPINNLNRLSKLIYNQGNWKVFGAVEPYQIIFENHELFWQIKIPKDFEILQNLYQYSLNCSKDHSERYVAISSLFDKLTFDQVIYLYTMVTSLYEIIFTRLRKLEVSAELPTGNDHYYDFCSYCLSLPRKRIQKLIGNPCNELRTHRLYYIKINGDYTYEREGYLRLMIKRYIEDRFGILDIDSLEFDKALDFLFEYKDFLLSTVQIQPYKKYEKMCK